MPEHYNAGDRMPEGVLLLDRDTGLPIPTSALGGVTLAELLGAVLPVAPNVSRSSGAVDANTQRVTSASDSPDVVSLANIDGKVLTNAQLVAALAAALIKTEPLGRLGVAYQIAATATASTSQALSAGVTRLRISARNANCRIAIGTGAQTATNTSGASTSHFLMADSSMDVACLAGSQISVIRGSDQTVDGIVHVSELI